MSLLLNDRNSKKSATILRAVPESTECETTLPPDQRDMTTQSHLRTNDGNPSTPASYAAPSPARSESRWGRKHKSNPSLSTTKSSPTPDVKKSLSNTSLKGAIGTYKHGKIQWRRKDRSLFGSEATHVQSVERVSRPKIQVVIPKGRCDQPLPALPFFESPYETPLRSIPTEHDGTHEVSPPSANRRIVRDSIVSPLSQSQMQPVSFGQFQRPMSHRTPKPQPRKPGHYKNASQWSNSSKESQESDASSLHSNRSSETSVEVDASPTQSETVKAWKYLPSGQTLVPDGVLQSFPKPPAVDLTIETGRQYPPPSVPPRKYTHQPPNETDTEFQRTCELQPVRHLSHMIPRKPTLNRKSSKRSGPRHSLIPNPIGVVNGASRQPITGLPPKPPRGPSPTLSEAECDLHEQLASLTDDRTPTDVRNDVSAWTPLAEDSLFRWDVRQLRSGGETPIDTTSQPRKDSATIELPHTPPPPQLPRKSSKRKSTRRRADLSRLPSDHIASQMTRGRSRVSKALSLKIPEFKRMTSEIESSPPPAPSPKKTARIPITPSGAEAVILGILRNLDHFQDLFAAAFVNHGFYRVFKRHELGLVKTTLRKMSSPAWEFREIAFPGHDHLHAEDLEVTRPEEEYTPTTYLQCQKQDVQLIREIKSEIMEKCQSFVRPEISTALTSEYPEESARVDDALWRIWTFCKIFGSGKGREDDIVAQMDWLNGGVLVHQQTCTFSITSTDFMNNDTLVSAPACFGKGNEGGLSAEQLFDMMELWNCLSVLLQSFEGRTVQARQAGIYDNTDVGGGDIDGEEMMLDEWCYHLLTFGLPTALKLTGPYHPSDPTAFTLAAENGWVNWKPPAFGGTRRQFLKEAASRVYEDKIARTYAKISTRDVQRQQSKLRIQKHIHELQHRKNNGEPRLMVRQSQERPMSDWDTVIRNLTRPPIPTPSRNNSPPPNNVVSNLQPGGGEYMRRLSASVSELPAARTPSPPRRTVAQPLLPTPPPSTVPSNRDRYSQAMSMPSIGEQPPSPPRRTVAQPLLPSPSVSTMSNRDLYTVSSMPSPPRRTVAQPLLPTPSPSTAPNSRDWYRYSTGTSMPSIEEHPAHRQSREDTPPELPSLSHPAFRQPLSSYQQTHSRDNSDHSQSSTREGEQSAFQQHEQQRHIYGSDRHENTADKAIYRIVEMGFTAEQAREALRMTDLGTGLRVDRAVELLLSRQS